VHPDAPPAQRDRDPPGADAEFECRPGTGKAGQEVHGWDDHGRVEQLRPKCLVPLSHPFIEVRLRHGISMSMLSVGSYAVRVGILIVDGANVVGSRPDGWWRDRAGAARRLQERLLTAELPYDEVVLVLEGRARQGNSAGLDGRLRTVHALGSGDDAIVEAVIAQVDVGDGADVTVVTADRVLRDRVAAAGAKSVGPSWLLDQL
jgi:hypothetical protein